MEEMLESRNPDFVEKIICLGTNCYLVIDLTRVTKEDLSKGRFDSNYHLGEPVKLTLSVQKRNCEELYSVSIKYPKEQDILEELPRIIHMYG